MIKCIQASKGVKGGRKVHGTKGEGYVQYVNADVKIRLNE